MQYIFFIHVYCSAWIVAWWRKYLQILQSPDGNFTIHRQRNHARIELGGSFSASSMSGFSYRDSLGHQDDSEEEPFSAITFGIRQPVAEASQVCHDFPSSPTRENVEQDASCPLLPKRKNYELQRGFISEMKIIGQGAFGLVARANMLLKNEQCVVAVKMLKGVRLDSTLYVLIINSFLVAFHLVSICDATKSCQWYHMQISVDRKKTVGNPQYLSLTTNTLSIVFVCCRRKRLNKNGVISHFQQSSLPMRIEEN